LQKKYLNYATQVVVVSLMLLVTLVFVRGTYQSATGLLGIGFALVGVLAILRGRFYIEGFVSDREVRGWAARAFGAILVTVGVALVAANWPVF
jgi:hypothetical protein